MPKDPKEETAPAKATGKEAEHAEQKFTELLGLELKHYNAMKDLRLSDASLDFYRNLVVGRPDLSSVLSHKVDPGLFSTHGKFEQELADLRSRVAEQTKALQKEKTGAQEKEKRIVVLESTLKEWRDKEQVAFLLTRVNQAAQRELLISESFRRLFLETRQCAAFVMSVDIRRSTELMLKARSPEAFAAFITTLCADLMSIVTESLGIFDKFTGDGVLASSRISTPALTQPTT